MSKSDVKKLIEYFLNLAEKDLVAYKRLKRSGTYAQALFFLHLVIEKYIKALIVMKIRNHPPYGHGLEFLMGRTGLDAPQQILDDLRVITGFNISSRYPDIELKFFEIANKEYSDFWHKRGMIVIKWLKAELEK